MYVPDDLSYAPMVEALRPLVAEPALTEGLSDLARDATPMELIAVPNERTPQHRSGVGGYPLEVQLGGGF
jgi:hypothetical protein